MFRTVPMSITRSFSLYTQQWHMPLLCVQWKTPGDGHRNCPKHVEFHSKNKFEKLVHLVGFIIGIYHDARSPEHQIQTHKKQYKNLLLMRNKIFMLVFTGMMSVFLNGSCLVHWPAHTSNLHSVHELVACNDDTYCCIQGVPGGKDLTSGECSLGQTIPI